jgi:4-hydroxybenzoate polyprenyltransferase
MKRITYWPQAVLGLAFNWGALMGYAAARNEIALAPVLLYAGSIAWTIGYDTIYAHQDKDDDALIGVKSTALRFGQATKNWLWGFYAAMTAALIALGFVAGLGGIYFAGIFLAAAQLVSQIVRLDIDDADRCLALFRSNRDFGLIVFAAIVAGRVFT